MQIFILPTTDLNWQMLINSHFQTMIKLVNYFNDEYIDHCNFICKRFETLKEPTISAKFSDFLKLANMLFIHYAQLISESFKNKFSIKKVVKS